MTIVKYQRKQIRLDNDEIDNLLQTVEVLKQLSNLKALQIIPIDNRNVPILYNCDILKIVKQIEGIITSEDISFKEV